MSRLIVVGAGGHGAVAAEAAAEIGRWREILFLDDDESIQSVLDFTVAGRIEELFTLADEESEVVVAIGDNRRRIELCEKIDRNGVRLAAVIHPTACISKSASISAGSVILSGAIVNARAKVGCACILNTGSTIDHDCVLEDGVHISPGANLGGTVRVGQCAWIGIGSSLREGVTIGRDSIIGAGAAVVSDVGDALTVGGVPAKELTKR
jgi:sugar O-acyltransferase (sialic acid O-acetyltransferase NeuD family)